MLGNQVLISGRRETALKAVCEANPGMRSFVLDVTDPSAIRDAARRVAEEFPALHCLINNAGVQKAHELASDKPLDEQAVLEEVNTNLRGVIRVDSAFLPHLEGRPAATFVNVSSELACFPVYCATKATALVHIVAAAPTAGQGRKGHRTDPALRRHQGCRIQIAT